MIDIYILHEDFYSHKMRSESIQLHTYVSNDMVEFFLVGGGGCKLNPHPIKWRYSASVQCLVEYS